MKKLLEIFDDTNSICERNVFASLGFVACLVCAFFGKYEYFATLLGYSAAMLGVSGFTREKK